MTLLQPAGTGPKPSRRAMFDTLLRHLGMVRLTATSMSALVALGAISSLGGCLGEVVTKEPGDPTTPTAKTKFIEVALPLLTAGACTGCHSSDPNYPFFAGADADAKYLAITTSSVVNFEAPQSSRLLSKGLHSGQPLTSEQAAGVLEWLTAERDERAGGVAALLETPVFTPLKCTAGVGGDATCPINTVALDSIGAPGASISFVYEQPTSTLTYLSDITLNAGPGGVFIEHPLFASIDAAGTVIPDEVDQFFSTKENLMGGAASIQLRGGTATFGFAPNNKMKLLFKSVKTYQADQGGGGLTGGCKKVPEFIALAKPTLAASCSGANCHSAAGTNANSALGLVGIGGTDPTELANACNQTLTRVNKNDVNNSAIFLAPRPGGAAHPFKFPNIGAVDTFSANIKLWIQQEITAP
ncbi:MAG: hypothetical protein KBG15_04995 [Kofleriaceae bacterium]|nr:hypothetical protein [Kofleriaceae bacterium]